MNERLDHTNNALIKMMFPRLFLLSLLSLLPLLSTAQDGGDLIRWVVSFKEDAIPDQIENLLAIANIDIPEIPLSIPELFMRVFMMDASLAKRVANLPIVDFIELDVKVKMIDPVKREVDSLENIQQEPTRQGNTEYIPYGIEMVQALQVDDSNVGNRIVCVIDSGYDLGHVDLPGDSVVTGATDVGVQPWDEDDNGHGTHVTGTIAALGNNGQGVIGVNGNGQLQLHIVRIFDETGESFSSDTVADVQACINAGANVVSMSFGRSDAQTIPAFGFGGPLEFEQRAFNKFYNDGTLLVAAAGNEGVESYNWPASYDSVMSVAAVNENKQVALFSQRNNAVDIAGPGVDVASTVPNDQYSFFSGTSMACPHVSGVAALVWSNFPDKSAQDIWQALIASAEDLGPPGRDDFYGFGLVQAANAMEYLASGSSGSVPTPSPPTEPTPAPGPSGCVDDPTWTDPWGDACDWYIAPFLCQAFGSLSANGGQTVNDACCVCGGGVSVEGNSPTDAPPDTPTSRAMQVSSTLPGLALCSLLVATVFCC